MIRSSNQLSATSAIFTSCMMSTSAWFQASLPIRMGCLGIRHAVQLAPSAYRTTAATTHDLVQNIFQGHLCSLPCPYVDQALPCRKQGHHTNLPNGNAAKIQRSWDFPWVMVCADSLLDNAFDDSTRATCRLLAVMVPECGAWLNALPIPALDLRLDDVSIWVAVHLHLGALLAIPISSNTLGLKLTG